MAGSKREDFATSNRRQSYGRVSVPFKRFERVEPEAEGLLCPFGDNRPRGCSVRCCRGVIAATVSGVALACAFLTACSPSTNTADSRPRQLRWTGQYGRHGRRHPEHDCRGRRLRQSERPRAHGGVRRYQRQHRTPRLQGPAVPAAHVPEWQDHHQRARVRPRREKPALQCRGLRAQRSRLADQARRLV